MKRAVSLFFAIILLIACSGCFFERGGRYGEHDREGYGDRDRGEHGDHDRGYGDGDRREHDERR